MAADRIAVKSQTLIWRCWNCVDLKSMVEEEGYVVLILGRMAFGSLLKDYSMPQTASECRGCEKLNDDKEARKYTTPPMKPNYPRYKTNHRDRVEIKLMRRREKREKT